MQCPRCFRDRVVPQDRECRSGWGTFPRSRSPDAWEPWRARTCCEESSNDRWSPYQTETPDTPVDTAHSKHTIKQDHQAGSRLLSTVPRQPQLFPQAGIKWRYLANDISRVQVKWFGQYNAQFAHKKHTKNPTWPWFLTYDLEIQCGSRSRRVTRYVKLHQAKCNDSLVIVLTEKKTKKSSRSVYTLSQKTSHFVIVHIFIKYSKLFHCHTLQTGSNSAAIEYPTTSTVLLHYQVKCRLSKITKTMVIYMQNIIF